MKESINGQVTSHNKTRLKRSDESATPLVLITRANSIPTHVWDWDKRTFTKAVMDTEPEIRPLLQVWQRHEEEYQSM